MRPAISFHRLLPLLVLLLSACVNDDTVDGEVVPLFTDIVTFEGNIDGHAHFNFNKVDDTPEINLVATAPLGGDAAEGTRMLLLYQPDAGQGAYESGPVVMRGVRAINNGVVSVADKDEIEGWNTDPVFVYSIWRSGKYVNIHCRLPFSETPRYFGLVATESTVDNDIVDIYLAHRLTEPVITYDRVYYASFDISEVWNRPTCKGVRLHVANSNLSKNIFEFLKSN